MDDGYIKYNCEWVKGKSPSNDRVKELIKWRTKFHDLKLIGKRGDIGYGNISIKDEEGVVISGTATGDERVLEPKHLSMIKKYDIDKNYVLCVGEVKASSETMTHLAIYEAVPSARAVIHIHSLKLWEKELDVIPTTSKDAAYGTPEIAHEVKRVIREKKMGGTGVIDLGGHEEGLIAYGSTVEKASNELLKLIE